VRPPGSKSPITLIRCDGYMCERESVDGSNIAFRGAATEQVMLVWNTRPSTVLLLAKKDPALMPSVLEAARHLIDEQRLRVIVEPQVQTEALANGLYLDSFTQPELLHGDVDFVVCLGGDGLILHVSTLFETSVPPVLSFNLGSLGFLTPFDYANFAAEITELLEGSCLLSLRMRLTCTILRDGTPAKEFEVLNEVVIDRGASPYLSNLDCFCDDKYITTVQADGIIMSTPTGSTAYSMSAGGSMVHPSVPAILFTPICPHSLSFRPIVFPDAAKLRIDISEDARSHAWASFDGKFRQQLRRGDGLVVQMSLYPVPTVNKTDDTGDWFQSLDRAFNFNSRAIQKGLPDGEPVPRPRAPPAPGAAASAPTRGPPAACPDVQDGDGDGDGDGRGDFGPGGGGGGARAGG
jgi:NAD+ kinase